MQWLHAEWLFPVARPPLRDAAVLVDRGRIVEVDTRARLPCPASAERIDLGASALLPGLVNAHTHLEFSGLRAPLGPSGRAFPDWIRALVAWRRSGAADALDAPASDSSGSPALPPAIGHGLAESLRAGVTTVGEIATCDWSRALAEHASPAERHQSCWPRLRVFRELLALSAERHAANVALGTAHVRAAWGNDIQAGLSPHAPYTVRPALLEWAVEQSATHRLPLAMHLAESVEELELLAHGSGSLVQLLSDLGAWDPSAIPLGARPMDYLRMLAQAPRALVIHGNYLSDDELRFVAEHRDRFTVVYCPRTHAYFGHPPHPAPRLVAAGVHVAIGTDSRASNPDLDLWAELRFVAQHVPQLAPADVLELGTRAGARALGLAEVAGTIEQGRTADLTVVPLTAPESRDPYERLWSEAAGASAVWCRGVRLTDGSW